MKEKFKKLTNLKLPGFMYRTHAILSVVLMEICMLLPLNFLQTTFGTLKNNILLLIVCVVILIGGALFPDMDNFSSKGGNVLGPLGSIMTTFMQSTSSIVWNVYHFKADKKPMSQHRYLWHTPIIAIGLIVLFWFRLPAGNYTIFTNIKSSIEANQLSYFVQTNAVLILFMILSFMATLIGSSIVLDKINKLVSVPKLIKYIFPVAVLVYIFTASYTQLRMLGICFGAGYLFHIIEDTFADSGVPLLFPIPVFWKNQVWARIKFPITAKTGGLTNTIIDFVAGITVIVLAVVIFTR